jgi:uncharacterized protein
VNVNFGSNKILIYTAVFLTTVLLGSTLFLATKKLSFSGEYTEIDWFKLGELDYVSGNAPESLKNLDGKKVRVPGFMVPLEDNMRKVTTFLLVPSPQACIHVPPPPPNQMVLVEGREEQNIEVRSYVPIWTYGTLHIQKKRHQYGESTFQISVDRVENYQ